MHWYFEILYIKLQLLEVRHAIFRLLPRAAFDVSLWTQPGTGVVAMSILSKSSLCPSCRSHAIYRSRRKGLLERIFHTVFFVSPFRCGACDKRYFRVRFRTPPHAISHSPRVT